MAENRPYLIGGEWRTSGSINEVRFPYNGEVIASVCQAAEADIEDAIQAAAAGFEKTRRMPSHERSGILYNLLDQMERRAGDFVEAMILEGGKTRGVAKGEFGRALETIRVSAEEAKRIGGEIIPIDWTKAGEQRMGFVRRLPLGPVTGIAPFNYPLNLACHKLGPCHCFGQFLHSETSFLDTALSLVAGRGAAGGGLSAGSSQRDRLPWFRSRAAGLGCAYRIYEFYREFRCRLASQIHLRTQARGAGTGRQRRGHCS